MNLSEHIYDPNFLILLAPFAFVFLFSVFFRTIEASHFFVNISRVLYGFLLAGVMYRLIGEPTIPPQDFFNALTIVFASLLVLFFVGKKLRYFFQLVALNVLIYFLFKNQFNTNPIFVVALSAVINILFSLMYGLAIGKKNILLKIVHATCILAIAYWALLLNQTLVAQVAILCSASIVMVVFLKIIFMGGVIPNFSRPLIDVGIPLILLWILINASGLFFEYLSPYTNIQNFVN